MDIAHNLKTLREALDEHIMLIGVSKTRTVAEIREAAKAGLCDFGENYVQEALPKIEALQDLSITWHFIGPIQSNKAKRIAAHFSWVHSVCSSRIAQQLNENRAANLPALNVCIQINIDREPTKSGVLPEEIDSLVTTILGLPRLHLCGLMIIPKPHHNHQDNPFLKTALLLKELNHKHHLHLKTLSMGMSDDFEEAIKAGSTCVRIGTKLFGVRQ